jgi:capsule polysaccharide export protein KpsE/RkpR
MADYREKYLSYKKKYLELKKQIALEQEQKQESENQKGGFLNNFNKVNSPVESENYLQYAESKLLNFDNSLDILSTEQILKE